MKDEFSKDVSSFVISDPRSISERSFDAAGEDADDEDDKGDDEETSTKDASAVPLHGSKRIRRRSSLLEPYKTEIDSDEEKKPRKKTVVQHVFAKLPGMRESIMDQSPSDSSPSNAKAIETKESSETDESKDKTDTSDIGMLHQDSEDSIDDLLIWTGGDKHQDDGQVRSL